MSRGYTHVQGLPPRVLAMKDEGYTNRQIADQPGLSKKQIDGTDVTTQRDGSAFSYGTRRQKKYPIFKTLNRKMGCISITRRHSASFLSHPPRYCSSPYPLFYMV